MGWLSRFGASREGDRADPWNEGISNGAPYARRAGQSDSGKPAVSGDPPDGQIAEEIKRRQVSLVVRYVATMRAR